MCSGNLNQLSKLRLERAASHSLERIYTQGCCPGGKQHSAKNCREQRTKNIIKKNDTHNYSYRMLLQINEVQFLHVACTVCYISWQLFLREPNKLSVAVYCWMDKTNISNDSNYGCCKVACCGCCFFHHVTCFVGRSLYIHQKSALYCTHCRLASEKPKPKPYSPQQQCNIEFTCALLCVS